MFEDVVEGLNELVFCYCVECGEVGGVEWS